MNRTFPPLVVTIFALSGLSLSCEKEPSVAPNPPITVPLPHTPMAPTARAGKDTTLLLPFSIVNLNGKDSSDPDSNLASYAWKKLTGPSSAVLSNAQSGMAIASNLITIGTYEFELTVTDVDKLSSKDTIKITIVEPPCTNGTKEIIFKNLPWSGSMVLEIADPFASLPPNSYVKNFYIKRDFSDQWELMAPYNSYLPRRRTFHEWSIGSNSTLFIFHSLSNEYELEYDTPDVKIEYCQ
jgi:hypothetical protein